MRIEDHLRHSAGRLGNKTAVIAGEASLTYAELDLLSDRLASDLIAGGIDAGDRVLIVAENAAEAVVAFFGIWKAAAVPCPLHATIKTDKLRAIIGSTMPFAILAQARFVAVVDAALKDTDLRPQKITLSRGPQAMPSGWVAYDDIVGSDREAAPPFVPDENALAILIHTSGSTGTPKGVMHSHASLLFACGAIVDYLGNIEDDIVLSLLPISFGYGITQILTMVMVGGTIVLEKSFAFPRKILARLVETRATGFPIVPAMAAVIAGMQDLQPAFLPDLRYITNAAAAMPPSVTARLRELLSQTHIFLMYGQTECIRGTYLSPEQVEGRALSVGKAMQGTQAFIIDEAGNPVPPGVTGELVIEGPHVMLGYWQDEVATRDKLAPAETGRRLMTGDLFTRDDGGFLYFVSRRDDIIKTRGEKVSPQEVERVLYALPGIREAAVAGIDDPIFGQLIRAYVALEPSALLSEKEILRHCAQYLEDYMVPKSVEFRDALPRTSTGKIRLNADTPAPETKEDAA